MISASATLNTTTQRRNTAARSPRFDATEVLELNADFSRRAAVHAERLPWAASPIAGVERRMLDRIGGEVARATSIVRYAPGSRFAAHTHGGGEEFLVLEGVFQDEHGDFPRGTYVRNPPASAHTPGSAAGCILFVKLWQFDPDDRHQICKSTAPGAFVADAARAGVALMPLYRDACEDVRLERWAHSASVAFEVPGGGEFLVLGGSFCEDGEWFTRHSWLRIPAGQALRARVGEAGCVLWVKTGHLAARCLARRPGPLRSQPA